MIYYVRSTVMFLNIGNRIELSIFSSTGKTLSLPFGDRGDFLRISYVAFVFAKYDLMSSDSRAKREAYGNRCHHPQSETFDHEISIKSKNRAVKIDMKLNDTFRSRSIINTEISTQKYKICAENDAHRVCRWTPPLVVISEATYFEKRNQSFVRSLQIFRY